MLHGFDHGLN